MNNISFFPSSIFKRRDASNKNYKISKKQLVSLLALGTIALVGSFILYNRSFQINKITKLRPLLKDPTDLSSSFKAPQHMPISMGDLLAGVAGVVGVVGVGIYSKNRKTEPVEAPPVEDQIYEPVEEFKSLERPIIHIQETRKLDWRSLSEDARTEELTLSKEELEQGMEIPDEAIKIIEGNFNAFVKKTEIDGFKNYLSSQRRSRIFSLDKFPNLIFKLYIPFGNGSKLANSRYKKMLMAKAVCRRNKLGLLKIPNAKFLTISTGIKTSPTAHVIVEKKLAIPSHLQAEDRFNECKDLDEAISQLAIFICETGYSDVEFRNNPPIDNDFDENGNRRIALIDLEKMTSQTRGLFGSNFPPRRGLVGCVNKDQGRIVERIAQKYGVNVENFIAAYNRRIEEIHEGGRLQEYHTSRNITIGDEPIEENGESIPFSKNRETQQKCAKIANDIIGAINKRIGDNPAESSIKWRRRVLVITSDDLSRETLKNKKYLGNIIAHLANQKIIYKLISKDGHRLRIQA